MKIRMLTLSAGPAGVVKPGTILDVPEKEAKELREGRYAEKVTDSGTRPATLPTPAKGGDKGKAAEGDGKDGQDEGGDEPEGKGAEKSGGKPPGKGDHKGK